MPKGFAKYLLVQAISLLIIFPVSAQELYVPVPELTGPLTDEANLLKHDEYDNISQFLYDFEKRKGSQIAVLIVNSTAPETIEEYSIRVVEKWKLGRKNIDDGVLLLVAVEDRNLRIEVGYGLEGAIPDVYAKRIISNVMIPEFRSGDFADGIQEGVTALAALIDGEKLPGVNERRKSTMVSELQLLGFVIYAVIALITLGVTRIFVKNKKRKIIIAVIISLIAGLVLWTWLVSIFAFIICLGFLFGKLGIPNGGGHSGSGWGGGSGGSSFGGFSGGGGSFGGGGASGSW